MKTMLPKPLISLLLPLAAMMPLACLADQKPNPYLSAPVYGLTHFNPAQTDTIPYAVKRGTFQIDLAKEPRVPGGPINIMTPLPRVSLQQVTFFATNERCARCQAQLSEAARSRGLSGDCMKTEFTLFLTTFTTLLAIINPLEALPVFLELMEGKGNAEHRQVAFRILPLCNDPVPVLSGFRRVPP